MAVRPVSSVSFRNYNNVAFEGKRKEKRSGDISKHATTPLKAVPLAVLLAMSPLNNIEVNAQNNVDLSRAKVINTVNYNSGKVPFEVQYFDSNRSPSSIEGVTVFQSDHYSAELLNKSYIGGRVLSYVEQNSPIYGDDGVSYGSAKFLYLVLSNSSNNNSYTISNPEMINDVYNFAISSKNKAIDVKNVEIPFVPEDRTEGAGLTAVSNMQNHTSWIKKIKSTPYDFGNIVGREYIAGSYGNYEVEFYSSNGKKADACIIKRDNDGLKCKVDACLTVPFEIRTDDGVSSGVLNLNTIEVSWPKVGKYAIYDDRLFFGLLNLIGNNSKYSNAVQSGREQKQTYNLNVKGGLDLVY